ncbi:hypothetical protein LINGRAHAP2_LOCUS20642 [Linum grandiflorum]
MRSHTSTFLRSLLFVNYWIGTDRSRWSISVGKATGPLTICQALGIVYLLVFRFLLVIQLQPCIYTFCMTCLGFPNLV